MTKIVFERAGDAIDALVGGRRVVAITDINVARLWAEFTGRWENIVVGAGERHKTLATVENIYRRLIELGADRDVLILGVGGGVVTDMAGFAAATWMRGVGFGFVPTTLLGMVDAAIGGKNGVDVGGFKNMAGTFAEPEFVVCDTGFLATLPDRELRAGLAEALKAGIIGDAELFALLEANTFDRIKNDGALLTEIVRRAVAVKMAIVGRDPREAGERRLLNLGHTVGHAIESLGEGRLHGEAVATSGGHHTSLRPLLHGEAVAVGMAAAARMAVAMGMLDPAAAARITGALTALGLPTSTDLDPTLLLDAIRADKKRYSDGVRFVLPVAIGHCTVRTLTICELQAQRVFDLL
jgi:3-dehydroquinate synthase